MATDRAALAQSTSGEPVGGIRPPVGAENPGGLRESVQALFPQTSPPTVTRNWQYSAALGVDLGLIRSSSADSRARGTEFTTILSPEVSVSGETRRLAVALNYAPQAVLYAGRGSAQTTDGRDQSYVAQNLNASATAHLIPGTLFVDARAIAAQTSRFGGVSYYAGQPNNSDVVQTYSFGLTPTFVQRFGGWANLRMEYGLDRTVNDNYANALSTTHASNGYGSLGSLTTQRERIRLETGENFDRYNYQLEANAQQFGEGQIYGPGSYKNSIENTLSYAISHEIMAMASLGYQSLSYGAVSLSQGYRYRGADWAVGMKLTPSADSWLTAKYGKNYGEDAFQFDTNVLITARIRFAANLSNDITTGLEQQQRLLNTTTVGVGGNVVDARTGLPVAVGTALGSQYGLSRVQQFNAALFYLLPRDTFSISATRLQTKTLVNTTSFNGSVVPANTSYRSTVGTLAWQHDLNPSTTLQGNVSYGVVNGAVSSVSSADSRTTFITSLALSHSFSPGLVGRVTYSHTENSADRVLTGLGSYSRDMALVGLRRQF